MAAVLDRVSELQQGRYQGPAFGTDPPRPGGARCAVPPGPSTHAAISTYVLARTRWTVHALLYWRANLDPLLTQTGFDHLVIWLWLQPR